MKAFFFLFLRIIIEIFYLLDLLLYWNFGTKSMNYLLMEYGNPLRLWPLCQRWLLECLSFFLSFFFTFLFFNLNPLFSIAFYCVFWSKPAAIIWAAFHTLQWALDLLRAPAAQWLLSRHHEVQDWSQAFSKSLCCFSGSSSCLLAEGLRSTDRQKISSEFY